VEGPVGRPAGRRKPPVQAQDLLGLGLIDKIIPEPAGAAHTDSETTFRNVDKHLQSL